MKSSTSTTAVICNCRISLPCVRPTRRVKAIANSKGEHAVASEAQYVAFQQHHQTQSHHTEAAQHKIVTVMHQPPLASLTLLVAKQAAKNAGPLSLIAAMIGAVLAAIMAIKSLLANRVRSCEDCKGFGFKRCSLCDGAGRVGWQAKLQHAAVCPKCLSKRFCRCESCGGLVSGRRIFNHHSLNVVVTVPDVMPGQSPTASSD